jgi:hypothetical protein
MDLRSDFTDPKNFRFSDPPVFSKIICYRCVHWTDHSTCKAYPRHIPKLILIGDVPHDEVRPDQVGGYVYEFYDRPPKFNIPR